MAVEGGVVVRVYPAPDDYPEELAELTGRLRAELLELDVQAVDPVPEGDIPERTKGLSAIAGWLVLNLGREGLRRVLVTVADWASRNGRTVEVTVGGDELKLNRATRDQQDTIIDAWLAQHPPGT
jgi:hypothetical protein